MNRTNLLFAVLLALIILVCGRETNQRVVTNERGERVAIGEWSPQELLQEFPKFNENYVSYQPDTPALSSLILPSDSVKVIIILGTWCSDSEREVPRFMKIVEEINSPIIQCDYICVDRSKRDAAGIAEKYQIEYVPTFIIKYHEKEIGRIVEAPQISLEEDLLEIFQTGVGQ